MRLTLMPGAGSNSYMVITGPGLHLDDLAVYAVVLQLLLQYPRVELDALLVDLDLLLLYGVEERDRGSL